MPRKNAKRGLLVGLTGGFGSGKSTVLSMLRRKGAVTLDADRIVHDLLGRRAVQARIRRRFGATVFTTAGDVDRPALARRIFSRTADRRALETILHPAVWRVIHQELSARRPTIAVIDVPLLFEAGWDGSVDRVVVVTAPLTLRRARLGKKGFSAADIRRRMAAQWPMKKKENRADVVIDNGGTTIQTRKQVNDLWHSLSRETRGFDGITARTKTGRG